MSGLDGDALLAIIRAWKPHILVVVISGRSTPIQKKFIDRRYSSFIAKLCAKTDSD